MCTTLDGAVSAHYEGHEAKASTSSNSSYDWLSLLKVWVQQSRERKELAELVNDDHLLKDIGVSRLDALREAAKPFWRR
jgi:uncharacterized protein YjiS (DUF1127 family)